MNYNFSKKISVKDIKEGIDQLANLGDLIGKENTVYKGMIEGINRKMNIDFESYMQDPFKKEAMVSELILQNLQNGTYVDLSDIKANLQFDHWIKNVTDYALKCGVK